MAVPFRFCTFTISIFLHSHSKCSWEQSECVLQDVARSNPVFLQPFSLWSIQKNLKCKSCFKNSNSKILRQISFVSRRKISHSKNFLPTSPYPTSFQFSHHPQVPPSSTINQKLSNSNRTTRRRSNDIHQRPEEDDHRQRREEEDTFPNAATR
jgi:hypothetical protein